MTINSTPIIHTLEGPVQDVIDRGAVAYMGIPYAAPPVGSLRWRPPRPVTPWTEVRQSVAYEHLNSCWQNPEQCIAVGGGDPEPMDEDCLYLNVWTPQGATETSKLPVMVWIHGGAYIIGAGKLPVYHGAPLVSRGAILVTFNYRMGALGFFAHDALDEGSENQLPINNSIHETHEIRHRLHAELLHHPAPVDLDRLLGRPELRRWCLDHLLILGERHLARALAECVRCFNAGRQGCTVERAGHRRTSSGRSSNRRGLHAVAQRQLGA